MYAVSQAMIFICGASAIYLLSRNDKYSKYGVAIGLLGQPFWFYSAITDMAWGIFLGNFIFTYSYAIGVYNFWFRKKSEDKKCKKV